MSLRPRTRVYVLRTRFEHATNTDSLDTLPALALQSSIVQHNTLNLGLNRREAAQNGTERPSRLD